MKRFFASAVILMTLCSILLVQALWAQDSTTNALPAIPATQTSVPTTATSTPTGKITGVVTDRDTKEPLPGAVVTILGTTLGANTDLDGRYMIVNVPVGTYSIQAKMMGFQTMTVTNVKAIAGLTTTVNFRLDTRSLESGKEVLIEAKRVMVEPSATSSSRVTTFGGKRPSGSSSPATSKPDASGAGDKAKSGTDGRTDAGAATAPGSSGAEYIPPAAMAGERPARPSEVSYHEKRAKPASPGMQAGSNDDNKQFNYYLGYLERFKHVQAKKLDIGGRVVFTVSDADGRPVANCPLTIKDGAGKILAQRKTYADGRAMFFTTEKPEFEKQDLKVEAVLGQEKKFEQFSHNGKSLVALNFAARRPSYNNVPVDVAFLLDCTGSMGDEIARLKQTLQVIQFQISQLPSRPAVRFGMVQYRDRGDEYVTRVTPFTPDVEQFQKALDSVQANGGGDEPEDVQAGLKQAIKGMAWREQACKLVFLVADAPPHFYDDQAYTYIDGMRDAAQGGIKIITVGASGLNDQGEYVFRQLSQYTMGQFVFLTYGETGEASGGGTAKVSHHTGTNFQTENLDAIIVRIIKQELANYGDGTIEQEPEYFETSYSGGPDKEAILKELFAEGIRQLLDYSIVRIDTMMPAAVMPVAFGDETLRAKAEALEDQIVLNLAPVKAFRLLERKDLRQIMQEQKLSLTGAFDDAHTVEVGKLVGAKILILPKLHRGKSKLELYLKLVKVETGEIMSITLLKLDEGLI